MASYRSFASPRRRGARRGRALLAALAALALSLPAASAWASPWTLPKEELVLSVGFDFQTAEDEFLLDGERRAFPLNGEFSSSSLSLSSRYGFTDRFEGELELNFKHVSFVSDPFIPQVPEGEGGGAADPTEVRSSIVDFSDGRLGAADFFVVGRYNLLDGPFRLTAETSVKFPTGYPEPGPNNVTLGDGQVDITETLQAGTFIPSTRTFGRLDLGFRARFGMPGHQAVGGFKIGQFFGDKFILFAGIDTALTVVPGEEDPDDPFPRIEDPETPASELSGEDITTEPFTLDKDFLRFQGGIILRFGVLELQVAYNQIIIGSNIPVLRGLSISSVLSASTAADEPAAPPSEDEATGDGQDEPAEEEVVEEVIIETIPADEAPPEEGEATEEPETDRDGTAPDAEPTGGAGDEAGEDGEDEETRPPNTEREEVDPPAGGAATP